ncbi:protein-L-isoaspartate(D-aspartate) O-methyltransferase [Andreprevotia lacus DSM 23236]|jgi:protein-L-isoaspartate(D-aspartate) O-methyltransferase|uniref:Protein-L-isoaspartate O-methyltransferase n=1 Tax=Andreprevotia lacus DSM 23236 TaxID=1121001 RepID=A0A1W1Y1C7_9NEIS|nr:protein-L-isoaspartate O-methyltransferase [Andreprevotia lacus]SMC29963.1 protein-L-isoaspartate(D-aspartate) O-methyltransferase [Andreprevotia lacus DSM 23236]
MDWDRARYLMVEQQIRPWDVLDSKVLQRLFDVKREEFVPADKKELAFVDVALPLPNGNSMLEPKLEARLLQDVELKASDRVLVVGAGTGYLVALAAGLAKQVIGVEIDLDLKHAAEANLLRAGIKNARIEEGNGLAAANPGAPFDAIILTGSVAEVPVVLREQLADGGRLIAIVGELPIMSAVRVTRAGAAFGDTKLFEFNLPRLHSASDKSQFVF